MQNHRDQSRHHVVLRFQRAVVPHPQAQVDGRAAALSGPAILGVRAQRERIIVDHAFGVAQRDGSRVGVAAVQQKLHRRHPPGALLLAVVARNHHPQQDAAAVDGALDGRICPHIAQHVEVPRSLELFHQVAAGLGIGLIVNQSGNMIHVQAQGVAVEQQHHHRQKQRQRKAALVAHDVAQLFDPDGPQAPQASPHGNHTCLYRGAGCQAC